MVRLLEMAARYLYAGLVSLGCFHLGCGDCTAERSPGAARPEAAAGAADPSRRRGRARRGAGRAVRLTARERRIWAKLSGSIEEERPSPWV